MSSSSALWLLLLWGNLLYYTSGSAITRQERSIRGDIQTLDCDASKKDPSKYYEMYWKVKGAEEIGYCNPKRECWKTISFLEDKRIQVVSISSSTLSIKRTLPQKTTGHTVTIKCEVHTTDNKIHVSDVPIVYSLESALPKAPRNVSVHAVKETYVEIKWERSPDDIGGKLRYSVDCFRCKSRKYNECNDSCGLSVRYKPNKDNITNGIVTINGLPPGSFLKFRVYSANDLNEDVKDRDKWNYDTVSVRTKAALPKAPRNVSVHVVNETYVEINWERSLDDIDGKLRYSVDCFRCKSRKYNECNDSCGLSVRYKPNKDNITNGTVTINGLPPGSFLKFRVYSVSDLNEDVKDRDKWNYDTVSVRTKDAQLPTTGFPKDGAPGEEGLSSKEKVVIAGAALGGGLLLLVLTITIIFVDFRFKRRSKRHKKEDRMQQKGSTNAHSMEEFIPLEVVEERNEDDVINVPEDITDPHSMEELNLLKVEEERNEDDVINVPERITNMRPMEELNLLEAEEERNEGDVINVPEGTIDTHPMEELNLPEAEEERNEDDGINAREYLEIINSPSFELKREKIEIERLLGSGNFGKVYKATLENDTVAVKSLKANATGKDKQDMITELDVMMSLKPHPHVLKLIGCCSNSDPLLIVLEYLPYGDLLGYLRKSRGHSDNYNTGEKKPASKLTAKDLLSFAWMIADGMQYLTTMKVIHRDLAARNILVGENQVCKISDFGLARDVNDDIYVRTSQARLPVKWMPPESIFHGESSTMSDVLVASFLSSVESIVTEYAKWSYGIVLWEVFTIGDSPYPGLNAQQTVSLLERGYRMQRPIHISEELFSIMSECWSEKPEERPKFKWIRTAVNRLMKDTKIYINLDAYNDADYVNFDMAEGAL